jgi:hypothetical protein
MGVWFGGKFSKIYFLPRSYKERSTDHLSERAEQWLMSRQGQHIGRTGLFDCSVPYGTAERMMPRLSTNVKCLRHKIHLKERSTDHISERAEQWLMSRQGQHIGRTGLLFDCSVPYGTAERMMPRLSTNVKCLRHKKSIFVIKINFNFLLKTHPWPLRWRGTSGPGFLQLRSTLCAFE